MFVKEVKADDALWDRGDDEVMREVAPQAKRDFDCCHAMTLQGLTTDSSYFEGRRKGGCEVRREDGELCTGVDYKVFPGEVVP